MSALATVAGKSLTANLLQKLIFWSGILYVTIADTALKVLSLFIHYLSLSIHYFDKYLDHMLVNFEQNRMARPI